MSHNYIHSHKKSPIAFSHPLFHVKETVRNVIIFTITRNCDFLFITQICLLGVKYIIIHKKLPTARLHSPLFVYRVVPIIRTLNTIFIKYVNFYLISRTENMDVHHCVHRKHFHRLHNVVDIIVCLTTTTTRFSIHVVDNGLVIQL